MKWLIEIVEALMSRPGSLVDAWKRKERLLGTWFKPWLAPFERVFDHLSPVGQRFTINLIIGIAIEIALFAFHDAPKLQSLQNSIFDMIMTVYSDLPLRGTSGRVPIRLVDIDDATYRDARWGGGEPPIAPRHELANVIVAVLRTGADEVVVDIVLDNRNGPEERELVREVIDSRRDSPNLQHLLLVRSLRLPSREQDATARATNVEASLSTVRRAAWDGAPASPGLQIHDVVPNFVVTSDHVLREWLLWQAACIEDGDESGHMVVFPSVQLELAAIRAGFTRDELPWNQPVPIQEERNGRRVPCIWAHATARRKTDELRQWVSTNLGLRVSENALASRIMYSIPWLGEYATPTITNSHTATPEPLFVSYSAQQLLGPDALGAAPKELPSMRGSVVLLGQTFAGSQDFHTTPVGNMPGVMVLANSIDTIFAYRSVREPTLLYRFALAALVIGLIAFMLAKWPRSRLVKWAFAVMLVFLLPITIWLFRKGVWLDVALPLIAIRIYVAIEARRRALAKAEAPVTSRSPRKRGE